MVATYLIPAALNTVLRIPTTYYDMPPTVVSNRLEDLSDSDGWWSEAREAVPGSYGPFISQQFIYAAYDGSKMRRRASESIAKRLQWLGLDSDSGPHEYNCNNTGTASCCISITKCARFFSQHSPAHCISFTSATVSLRIRLSR